MLANKLLFAFSNRNTATVFCSKRRASFIGQEMQNESLKFGGWCRAVHGSSDSG
jgi:hypothetical protein